MTDADYVEGSCLKQIGRGIGLNGNTNKTKLMSFKQEGAIATVSGKPLKSVD